MSWRFTCFSFRRRFNQTRSSYTHFNDQYDCARTLIPNRDRCAIIYRKTVWFSIPLHSHAISSCTCKYLANAPDVYLTAAWDLKSGPPTVCARYLESLSYDARINYISSLDLSPPLPFALSLNTPYVVVCRHISCHRSRLRISFVGLLFPLLFRRHICFVSFCSVVKTGIRAGIQGNRALDSTQIVTSVGVMATSSLYERGATYAERTTRPQRLYPLACGIALLACEKLDATVGCGRCCIRYAGASDSYLRFDRPLSFRIGPQPVIYLLTVLEPGILVVTSSSSSTHTHTHTEFSGSSTCLLACAFVYCKATGDLRLAVIVPLRSRGWGSLGYSLRHPRAPEMMAILRADFNGSSMDCRARSVTRD